MIRKLLLVSALAFAPVAHAADKGKPATLADIMALPERPASVSCYVETSVAGTFLRDDRQASAGIGGGCDTRIAALILGGGIRADFSDFRDAGSIFARIGLPLNSGATVYGLAEWKMPGWSPKDTGQLAIGGGGEVKLDLLSPNMWLFSEATYAASKWGQTTADDVTGRLGLRWKF
jgi:hypothetical protein